MSKLSASIAAAMAASVLATVATAQNASVRDEGRKPAPAAPGVAGPSPSVSSEVEATVGATNGHVANGNAPATAATPVPQNSVGVTTPERRVAEHPPVAPDGPTASAQAAGAATTASTDVRTPPPRVYRYRFLATVDLANVLWRSGRGGDLFSDQDARWRFGIGFGYDALELPASLTMNVEAGLLHEPAPDSHLSPAFGSLRGSLSATSVLLGTSLRWAVASWLAPYARLGLLATRVGMDLDASAAGNSGAIGASWSHHKWVEGALFGAGVAATMPPQNPVSFGVLVEGGLWLQRAVDIQLDRELPSDAIPTSGARVGKLENTGPYVRIAGLLRF